MVNMLGLKAYERNNFKDVLTRDYFASSTLILKKLGIADGDNFEPKKIMTEDEAASMLKKAGYDVSAESGKALKKKTAARMLLECGK